MTISGALHIVLAVYVVATLFYLLRLIINHQKLSAIALRVTVIGLICQLGVLGWHFFLRDSRIPWSYLEYFQLTSVTLSVVFVGLCFFKRFYSAGPFFITLIDLFYVFSLSVHNPHLAAFTGHGARYLYIHLICIFLSLAIFSIALTVAIMFLLSEWQIKHKRFDGIVSRFPALSELNDIHYRTLYAGFIFFSFAILTGAGYSKMVHGHYLSNDPKQFLSFLSWCFFAILLNFRVRQGWQGHKGVLLSLAGFSGIVLSFVVGLT